MLSLPQHLNSNPHFSGVRFGRLCVFCVACCTSLFVLFLSAIALSVLLSAILLSVLLSAIVLSVLLSAIVLSVLLRFTNSKYISDFVKLFLHSLSLSLKFIFALSAEMRNVRLPTCS